MKSSTIYWKLGCNWGSNTPSFLKLLQREKIVITFKDKIFKKGDLIALAQGHDIKAIVSPTISLKSIKNRPDLENEFKQHEIPFNDDILFAPVVWYDLKPTEIFQYKLQQGICNINKGEIRNKVKSYWNYYHEDFLKKQAMTEITNLLNHKPQIILQGPPGTGKTYEAKNIAESLIRKDGKISENKKEQAEFLKKSEQFELIQFHPSYTYEDFVRGIIVNSDNGNYETQDKVLAEFAKKALDDKDKKYILVVDEINRANLPSVLGELIYALEYRDEVVTSMYEKDGDGGKIILPSNLYIIGTMNTADRSVGHIDYAIRRRFAFVDMLPDIAVITNPEAKILFKEVEKIFDNHLATDFQKNDVQLGHSYFLVKNEDELSMRLNYEILPILREYLKDGIFLQEAEKAIENLVR